MAAVRARPARGSRSGRPRRRALARPARSCGCGAPRRWRRRCRGRAAPGSRAASARSGRRPRSAPGTSSGPPPISAPTTPRGTSRWAWARSLTPAAETAATGSIARLRAGAPSGRRRSAGGPQRELAAGRVAEHRDAREVERSATSRGGRSPRRRRGRSAGQPPPWPRADPPVLDVPCRVAAAREVAREPAHDDLRRSRSSTSRRGS